MRTSRNENGAVLLFVLLLSIVALVTTAGLLHMLARGGYISGQQKRYNTALEAGRGGLQATLEVVASRGDVSSMTPLVFQFSQTNLDTKLANPTSAWGMGLSTTSVINPGDNTTYDLQFDLGGYAIYSKIVDTVEGNSGADEDLLKGPVVGSGSGEVTVMSIPYLYTIEELAQSQVNPSERAKISVLYQY